MHDPLQFVMEIKNSKRLKAKEIHDNICFHSGFGFRGTWIFYLCRQFPHVRASPLNLERNRQALHPKKLSAWNGGKVALVENFAMVKFMTRDEVRKRKNSNRIPIGDAAPQPCLFLERPK